MPGRKLFRPSTRQQDEREITRGQKNFSAGVYNDIPASNVLDNALAQLKNFINFGNRLIGRAGSKRMSNTRPPIISGRGPYSATKSGAVVTLVSGDATGADVNSYCYWSDTKTYERIISVTDSDNFNVHTSAVHAGVADMTLAGSHNGSFFHKEKAKAVHHVHDKIYTSDYNMSAYTAAIRNSIDTPDRFKTIDDEFQDQVIKFSNKAIFRIDLKSNPPIYYPINKGIPTVRIEDSGSQSDSTPYGYRYLYTMVRLSGTGNLRDRNTDRVEVELESGSVKYDKISHDYGEVWQATDTFAGTQIGPLTVPVDSITGVPQEHFSHIGVYRTLDLGGVDPVIGTANETELYIWVADIPIMKAFTASQSGTEITATFGEFGNYDIGSKLFFQDGNSDTIDAYTRSGTVRVLLSRTIASQSAAIGNGEIFTVSQAAFVVTATAGRAFTAADVGKRLQYADGRWAIITEYTSATKVNVHISMTVASQGACMSGKSRMYTDTMTDTILRRAIGAWVLFSRHYQEIPPVNTGVITPGWLFAAQRNGSFVYYCEIPVGFEYLTGYYYAASQFFHVKDKIVALREFPDKLIIYCKNSTYEVPLNNFDVKTIDAIGVVISTIVGRTPIDPDIGCADHGSIQSFGKGKEILVTNDHGIRIFDSQEFSKNLVANRIMKRMTKLQPAFVTAYDEENGYTLGGREP